MLDTIKNNAGMNGETGAVRNVIDAVLKARKTLRIYPRSNPVYMENLEYAFNKFNAFFDYNDKLTLRFAQNNIYYDSESVYNNPRKQENLALLLFKDGVREISFKKDVTREEIEGFLEIIAADFNKETIEDDVVTLLWQSNFNGIEYIAEDLVLTDEEINELSAVSELKQTSSDQADLQGAYADSPEDEEVMSSVPVIPLTEEDEKEFRQELERDNRDKLLKYFNMLFEIYHDVERSVEYDDIVYFFMKSIEYSIRNGNVQLVTDVILRLKKIVGDKETEPDKRKSVINILLFISGKKMIGVLGELLNENESVDKEVFQNYAYLLDQNAISPLINLLVDLRSIDARKMVMDSLTSLILKDTSKFRVGSKDITRLIKELSNADWYVVNKIIYILSRIGNGSAVEYIKKAVKHDDVRVKMEAIRVLGELGKDNVLGTMQECLEDTDIKVRKAALTAIGNIGTGEARNIIIQQISRSGFIEKELNEKKEYFRALSRWKDRSVYDFCMRTVKRKSFLNRSQHDETKACALYGLGLIGKKDALPILNKYQHHSNKLFKEISEESIKRIENGG